MLIPFAKAKLREFVRSESGATAIEYGLIAGLIAVVIIGAVTTVGTDLIDEFQAISNGLTGTTPPAQ
jgi:pilus assembly protein Flp/PilA